jgi:hypothetical protein
MIYIFTAIIFFILGGLVARHIYEPRILHTHDPNTPFTAKELHHIGIMPPKHYDEWLDEFAKR